MLSRLARVAAALTALLVPSLALADDPPAAPAAAAAAPLTAPGAAAAPLTAPGAVAPPLPQPPPAHVVVSKVPSAREVLRGRDRYVGPRTWGRRARVEAIGPNTPVAYYPGFRMLDNGRSRVLVEVSRKVEITEHRAQGRITYRLGGTRVPTRTNRLPLITGFFSTPVARVELVEQGADTDLVIDLRVPSELTYKTIDTAKGLVLLIDFPSVKKDAFATTLSVRTDLRPNLSALGAAVDGVEAEILP